MVLNSQLRSVVGTTLLTLGLATGAIAPLVTAPESALATAPANPVYPDIQNHWAQPFIRVLTERGILAGYPDNTFRPEQPVARDEFAAVIRQAFSQDPERQIASGSVYTDVPQGYWAAPAIQEAYEMGFMKGYPGGEFRPNQPVTKVEALVSLARNLNLPQGAATEAQPAATAAAPSQTAPAQPDRRRQARGTLLFPLGITALMQPLMTAPASANAPQRAPAAAPQAASSPQPQPAATSERPVSLVVSDYYQDAEQIPQYAVADVAETTRAGIVVNHPDRRILNPTQPATRGEVAALIHQALVHQGRLEPLPADQPAANYIVDR